MNIDLPLYYQELRSSCLPASGRMVLAYYGLKLPESLIRKEMRFSEKRGASITDLADYFNMKNLQLQCLQKFGSFSDGEKVMKEYLNESVPVIVSLAFNDIAPTRKHLAKGHSKRVVEYHSSVLTGFSRSEFFLNDPFRGTIAIDKEYFRQYWHNDVTKGEMLAAWR